MNAALWPSRPSGEPTDPNTGNTDTNVGISLDCYQFVESGTLDLHLDIVFVYMYCYY